MSPSNPNFDKVKLAYRLGELARACSLSIDFVQAQIRTGKLPARKMGRMVIILADDAKDWLKNQPLISVSANPQAEA